MKKILNAAALTLAAVFAGQAHASTTTINLNDVPGNPQNNWFNAGGTPIQIGSPYTTSTSVGGAGNTAVVSPIVNGFLSAEHIHVGGATPNLNLYTHTDTGGIYFDVLDAAKNLKAFSFDSMDVLVREFNIPANANDTYTFRGYRGGVNGMNSGGATAGGQFAYVGGSLVAEAVLTNLTPLGVFNFLAADSHFGNVDHVEMFFTDYYRQTLPGANALYFQFDNVKISDVSAVPVPAAVWLFGTGLLGVVSFGRKKASQLAV